MLPGERAPVVIFLVSVPPRSEGPRVTIRIKTTTKPKRDLDLPLREDIRYLGRILGDTIREQAGTFADSIKLWSEA